jgi:acyl-coenzyme A thioesterase PaaI-like protein
MLDGSEWGTAVLNAALAVLCDSGLGLAIMERRGDGDGGITLDLRVDLVQPVPPATRLLSLVSRAVHLAPDHGVSRADVHDDSGLLIAHAVGTLAVSPSLPIIDRDPASRPHLDLATVFEGVRVADAGGPDVVAVHIPVRVETENTRGIVHGALLVAAGLVASREARRATAAGRLLWFSAEFLRPVPAEVGELRALVRPVRSSRRFANDRVELLLPDGRVAACVTTAVAMATATGSMDKTD